MVVNFNKFEQYETPDLMLCYPGSTYVNGAVTYPVGVIPFCSDVEFVFNFNDVSELNFRVNLVHERSEYYVHVLNIYSKILKNMYIFVADIGFFRIENVDETVTEYGSVKDISASSCEVELTSRAMPFIEDGQYRITELIYDKIRPLAPQWNMNPHDLYIDQELLEVYRSFSDVNIHQNIYDFIINEIQEAYNCVFIFDIISRHISVYTRPNYIHRTSIHLTTQDILAVIKATESDDGVYSAMSGSGIDDITFSAINPLGGDTVYDFGYYLDWMPKELASKVMSWSDSVTSAEEPYYNAAVSYTNAYNKRFDAQAEVDRLNTLISVYMKCESNIQAYQTTVNVDLYNDGIESDNEKIQINDDISETINTIRELTKDAISKRDFQAGIASEQLGIMLEQESIMSEINSTLSFEEYFSDIEYSILANYIHQGAYSDELIGFTDNTHDVTKLHLMRLLYNKTKQMLTRVSSQIFDFNLDTDNFIFLSKFSSWTEQLQTGCTIDIEMRDGHIERPFVTSITVNYEDQSSSIGVSGALRKNNNRSLFKSVFDGITKTNSTISRI